ncbi:hypothetical protein AB6A23_05105 [Paenibacillus tarimensis]
MKVIPFPNSSRVILSKTEFNRLNWLSEKVDTAIHPAEVHYYASEIKAIIEKAKQRPTPR